MAFSLRFFLLRASASSAALLLALGGAAVADPIRHPTAIFAGLDKTTGRIINFDVAIDETVQFGTLQVTPRVCNTRPQTEAPQTTSFVEVDENQPRPEPRRDAKGDVKIDPRQEARPLEAKRIFSGWMFAASPGLHGVEHPVYDVSLVDCKGGKEIAAQPVAAPQPAADVAAAPAEGRKRGKSRKVEPAAPVPVEAQPIGPDDAAAPAPNVGVDADVAEAAAPPQKKPKPKKPKKPKPAAAPPAGGDPLGAF